MRFKNEETSSGELNLETHYSRYRVKGLRVEFVEGSYGAEKLVKRLS